MNERVDELKGTVKENVGKMTGNTEMEAEGRGEKDVASAKRNVKGAAKQAKGGIERGVGKMTDDPSLEARGEGDRLRGDADRTG
jgi:uncharacterized protein YjbJ (UPF0337 family)